MRVQDQIRNKLTQALNPSRLDITDDSARHAGHAGARPEGESHFTIEVVSARFAGLSRLERQRLIYRTLAEEMARDIHALAVTARTPEEDR